MTDTTTNPAVAVELYQRMGGGLVPLLVQATDGDTTDVEALIAAAVAAHNADPEAHPDIRQAIEDAGGSGGGLVTTPVLTLAERLPIGFPATLGMAAIAGLNGAHVVSFSVTVGNAEPVTVDATDNAATYTFTPSGNEGDMVSVSVVAADNFGNRSGAGAKAGMLYIKNDIVLASNGTSVLRSADDGHTWGEVEHAPPIYATYMDVASLNNTSRISVADNKGFVSFSSDKGLTWSSAKTGKESMTASCLAASPNGIHTFIGGNYGYSATDSGRVSAFYFNGECAFTSKPKGFAIKGVFPISDDIVIAIDGLGKLFRSTNGGLYWSEPQQLAQVTNVIVCTINETSEGDLILFSSDGGLVGGVPVKTVSLRSTDKGITWIEAQHIDINRVNTCVTAPDGSILIGGSIYVDGSPVACLQRSTDKGYTWSTPQKFEVGMIRSFVTLPDGAILAFERVTLSSSYVNMLLRSTDNGVNWTQQQVEHILDNLHSVIS